MCSQCTRKPKAESILDGEFNVDHPARIVLQVELGGPVRVPQVHAPAHADNVGAQLCGISGESQDRLAQRLEGGADGALSRHEAGSCQRLMLEFSRYNVD